LIEFWLTSKRVRELRFSLGEDQNPEYRIAEDARVATDAPVNMAGGLLSAFLSAIIFVSVLWNVGGDLDMEVFGHVLTIPKYLVITVFVYSALLSAAMMLIGRNLTRVIEGKNAAEAQFRSVASRLRRYEDSAGPGKSVAAETLPLTAAFNTLVGRWRNLCWQLMRTTLVSQGNVLAAPVIGWILCAPKYLVGTMSLGEVAQAVSAFVIVQSALNWIVDNYPGMAECLSSVNRVGSLLVALDEPDLAYPCRAVRV
jgi:putative ATP-binding cassette transporter